MQLLRFMSLSEFNKFRAGDLLENTTNHNRDNGRYSDAEGFCFLDYSEYDEQYAYHFLSGIASNEVVAVFEVSDEDAKKLKVGSGTFADPHGSFFQSMQVEELSTPRYHNKAFKLLKFCDDFADRYKEDTFDRIFDWKQSDAPAKPVKPQPIANKAPSRVRSANLDPAEQKLMDAIKEFVTTKSSDMPADMFDGFKMRGFPSIEYTRSISYDTLTIEGLEFVRAGSVPDYRI